MTQTYIEDEDKLKEEIVLDYIRNSKSFKAFLNTLNDINPLEGVKFTFVEKSKAIEREFNEEDLKRNVYSKKIETKDDEELKKKMDKQYSKKRKVVDADGSFSYEQI